MMMHGPCGAGNLSAPLQTVNNVFYPTCRAVCQALGLPDDDKEWDNAFKEACVSATSAELRSLFAQILTHCDVTYPSKLWTKYWKEMSNDIPKRVSEMTRIPNYHLNDSDLKGRVPYEIELILRNFTLMQERHDSVPKLNKKLKKIYDLIIGADATNKQELRFVYVHGGTGKTFLWKTIIITLRSEGKIVLAIASSGITSLLLPSGRTAHFRFKLPLELTKESPCRIIKNTHLGKLLADNDLIVWDEAPMNDLQCFEALDKSLRDIRTASHSLFGGKSVILGGDFRQTLRVKKRASKMEVISSCIFVSELWSHFKVFTLKENMRLMCYRVGSIM
ncbi:DNA helicase [Tanacetum coccineum]